MKKLLALFSILLIFSCSTKQKNTLSTSKSSQDSISSYIQKSTNPKLKAAAKLNLINKAFKLAKNSGNDSIYTTVLTQKTYNHLILQQYDSLLFYSNLNINHSKYSKEKINLGYQYFLKAYYFNVIAQNKDSAFVNYNLSKNQYKAVNDSSWIAKNLISISNIQKNKSDFFGSKETITEALHYLNPDKDSLTVARAYNSLATNHRKLLNYNDAELYYKKAINLTTSPNSALTYKNNLAASYISAKKYTKAITLLTEVYENDLTQNDKKQAARVL
ncbi:MAG: hypothetical protein ACSHWV_05670, partial [Cellulophaga fucicola]